MAVILPVCTPDRLLPYHNPSFGRVPSRFLISDSVMPDTIVRTGFDRCWGETSGVSGTQGLPSRRPRPEVAA